MLAYRYEGLRRTDFNDIVNSLRNSMLKEIGPVNERPSARRYASWVSEMGGTIKGSAQTGNDGTDDGSVVHLRLLKQSNEKQMSKLYSLLSHSPDVIHWYLGEYIFPVFLRHQEIKLSESGQGLGGSMLFERRIGFSGTPSDLLPVELGKCGYEKGSDGQILHTMTSPDVVHVQFIDEGWTVDSLLDLIARAENPVFHSLIDTGALITGLSNLEVAQALLRKGLEGFDGVVFLDEFDRKMILVRATGRVVKLDQCGIEMSRRFVFYDQGAHVHVCCRHGLL